MNEGELTNWLLKLESEIQGTNHCYPKNLVAGWPIPFFGNILCARVLTIGVNPSQIEFNANRGWDAVTSATQWQERLKNYFHIPGAPPANWFETWSIGLDLLRLSYSDGTAAHIDISPRPTFRMLDKTTDKAEFRQMVENDIKWFFELLNNLTQIELLLVAGPIPTADGKIEQLMDCILGQSGKHGTELIASNELPRLKTPSHPDGIPIFICKYEPQIHALYSIVRQIYRNCDMLQKMSNVGRPM